MYECSYSNQLPRHVFNSSLQNTCISDAFSLRSKNYEAAFKLGNLIEAELGGSQREAL